jgi:hypothetical protein
MRGRTERYGRVTRIVYSEESGTFFAEDEIHPFIRHLDEHLAIASVTRLRPLTPRPGEVAKKTDGED